jgi:hypothetical protein
VKEGVGPAGGGSGPPVEYYRSDLGFRTYGAENTMVAVTGNLPSRPDGSGSVSFASFNIQSGRNGGLEGALRAIDQMRVDIGFLLETKLTGGIYTRYSSGYSVLASSATSVRQ